MNYVLTNLIFMNFSEYYDDSDQKVREFYECPSPEDPPDHTRCCETESCCKVEQKIFKSQLNTKGKNNFLLIHKLFIIFVTKLQKDRNEKKLCFVL